MSKNGENLDFFEETPSDPITCVKAMLSYDPLWRVGLRGANLFPMLPELSPLHRGSERSHTEGSYVEAPTSRLLP